MTTLTRHEALKRFTEFQRQVDQLLTARVLTPGQLSALRSISRTLLSGTTVAMSLGEMEAVSALGRYAGYAGETLSRVLHELEPAARSSVPAEAVFRSCQILSGRFISLYSESLGEVPAIVEG